MPTPYAELAALATARRGIPDAARADAARRIITAAGGIANANLARALRTTDRRLLFDLLRRGLVETAGAIADELQLTSDSPWIRGCMRYMAVEGESTLMTCLLAEESFSGVRWLVDRFGVRPDARIIIRSNVYHRMLQAEGVDGFRYLQRLVPITATRALNLARDIAIGGRLDWLRCVIEHAGHPANTYQTCELYDRATPECHAYISGL